MPGEGQLLARGEDAQAIVGLVALQQEGRLGEVGPAGDALHGRGVQALGADHHRHRVAEERPLGEDVHLLEFHR
jgi:hypothetical protein